MRQTPLRLLLLATAWLIPALWACAHEGPPFAIVMDRKVGPYSISVWTDPDVGIGTFYVILEPATGTELSEDIAVDVCVRPLTDRLPEVCYPGKRQAMRNRVQFYAEVEFDQQEMWGVRVKVTGPDGTAEVLSEVEATPPGYGAWDLLIYGFPFILFGALWAYVALRRARQAREPVPPPVSAEPPVAR